MLADDDTRQHLLRCVQEQLGGATGEVSSVAMFQDLLENLCSTCPRPLVVRRDVPITLHNDFQALAEADTRESKVDAARVAHREKRKTGPHSDREFQQLNQERPLYSQ